MDEGSFSSLSLAEERIFLNDLSAAAYCLARKNWNSASSLFPAMPALRERPTIVSTAFLAALSSIPSRSSLPEAIMPRFALSDFISSSVTWDAVFGSFSLSLTVFAWSIAFCSASL